MSFNQVENSILAHAIRKLGEQLGDFDDYKSYFGQDGSPPYLGDGVTFCLVEKGKNINKLTAMRPGTKTPDPRLRPVNCYNLMKSDEDMATAVSRLESEGYPLEEWELEEG